MTVWRRAVRRNANHKLKNEKNIQKYIESNAHESRHILERWIEIRTGLLVVYFFFLKHCNLLSLSVSTVQTVFVHMLWKFTLTKMKWGYSRLDCDTQRRKDRFRLAKSEIHFVLPLTSAPLPLAPPSTLLLLFLNLRASIGMVFLLLFYLLILIVAVRVDGFVFAIALQQQVIPLVAVDARQLRWATVGGWQEFWRNVLVQRLRIVADKNDATAQLFAQERFEQGEHDVEDFRLVDDVNAFDTHRHRILQPVDDTFGKLWRKLPRLLQRQTVHVEDDDRAMHLGLWLKHGRLQEDHTPLEHLVQSDLFVLPSFCTAQRRENKEGNAIRERSGLGACAVHLLPNSSSNILRPSWSRFGNTTRMFCLKIFVSFEGIKFS